MNTYIMLYTSDSAFCLQKETNLIIGCNNAKDETEQKKEATYLNLHSYLKKNVRMTKLVDLIHSL